MLRSIFLLLLSLFLSPPSGNLFSDSKRIQELVLESRFREGDATDPKISVFGETQFLERSFSPASTFKTYLSLSLLKNEKVRMEEKLECSDKHVPGAPRKLNLREALFYSSNEYFEKTFPRLGKKNLHATLVSIGYVNTKDPSEWWTDLEGMKHAGNLRKTPTEIHTFWQRIFRDGYGFSDKIRKNWKESLFWSDCEEREGVVFGKTGSWEASFWFQGALHFPRSKDYVVFTILQRGESASRSETIRRFYELVGCKMPSLE